MLEKIVQTIEEKEALIATLKQEVKDLKATLVDPVKLIIKRLDAVECKLNSIEHSLAQNFVSAKRGSLPDLSGRWIARHQH
jgi:predicted ATP-grasp superfamily ATP-dependent carboligase